MMYKIIKEKFLILKGIILITICFISLIFGKYSAKGITNGIILCTKVLIPSLFPFMILANFTVKSGISDFFGKQLGRITNTLFGVTGNCGAVILLSLIGGYPVGAKGIASLYKENKITQEDAVKLSYSLVCAGPGFLITYIGTNTLNCPQIGICLLISHILSVFLIGFINKLIYSQTKSIRNETNQKSTNLSDSLIESVRESTYSMIEMCGIVMIFSALLSIIEVLLHNFPILFKYIVSLCEITTASNMLCKDYNILLLAFALGFGGISIHFQIFQALKIIPIKKWVFMLYRFFQGIINTAFTYILIKTFKISIPTYSSISEPTFTLSTSVIGSVLLILLGLCFINQGNSPSNPKGYGSILKCRRTPKV